MLALLAAFAGLAGCRLPSSDPGSEMLALLSGKGGSTYSDRLTALESLIRREIPELDARTGLADSLVRWRMRMSRSLEAEASASPHIRARILDSLLGGIRLREPADADSAFRLSLPGEGLRTGEATRLGRALLRFALLDQHDSEAGVHLVPDGFAVTGPDASKEMGQSAPRPPETLLALLADAFAAKLMALDRPEAAEGVCRAVLGMLPGHPPALRNLSVTLAAQGRGDEAAKALAEAEAADGPGGSARPRPD